jgi:hypothetical protein
MWDQTDMLNFFPSHIYCVCVCVCVQQSNHFHYSSNTECDHMFWKTSSYLLHLKILFPTVQLITASQNNNKLYVHVVIYAHTTLFTSHYLQVGTRDSLSYKSTWCGCKNDHTIDNKNNRTSKLGVGRALCLPCQWEIWAWRVQLATDKCLTSFIGICRWQCQLCSPETGF